MKKKTLVSLLSLMALCIADVSAAYAQELSPTRRLRRVTLALTQQEPDVERYEALLEAPDPDAFIEAEIDALMQTSEFHAHLIDWGRDYIPFPRIDAGRVWDNGKAIDANRCGEDSLYPGAVVISSGPNSNDGAICNDPEAPTSVGTPWWAPDTMVMAVGNAANFDTFYEGTDCGVVRLSSYWVAPPIPGCGCGPNFTFCSRGNLGLPYEGSYPKGYGDGELYHPESMNRALMDEPANLLAYIVTEGRPFSDLVLGNYTVANRGLYHMYLRAGRMSGVHTDDDAERWFEMFTDNREQIEVSFSNMNPHWLDDPDYTYDPRDGGELEGLPASGVLTMIGPNTSWPRPRVRAARWLESLACDEFSPPEIPIEFPAYQRDPATEGVCLHCHTRLDPAAISFKRIYGFGGSIAGLGEWKVENLVSYNANRKRFEGTYLPNTVMTPITEEEAESDLNVRLIDYMPPEQKLLGQVSDGTIGPRGFAKILVQSGAFDRCAVRRAYERFGGRTLDVGQDAIELEEATKRFVESGRDMGALIRALVLARTTGW